MVCRISDQTPNCSQIAALIAGCRSAHRGQLLPSATCSFYRSHCHCCQLRTKPAALQALCENPAHADRRSRHGFHIDKGGAQRLRQRAHSHPGRHSAVRISRECRQCGRHRAGQQERCAAGRHQYRRSDRSPAGRCDWRRCAARARRAGPSRCGRHPAVCRLDRGSAPHARPVGCVVAAGDCGASPSGRGYRRTGAGQRHRRCVRVDVPAGALLQHQPPACRRYRGPGPAGRRGSASHHRLRPHHGVFVRRGRTRPRHCGIVGTRLRELSRPAIPGLGHPATGARSMCAIASA